MYIDIALKRLWIIVLLPVLAAAVSASVGIFVLKPVYQAGTTLYVYNKNPDPELSIDYYDIIAGQQLLKDYREIIISRRVMTAVIGELGLTGVTADSLAKKVSIVLRNDTRVMEIRCHAGDPESARQLADTVGKVFIEQVILLTKTDNICILDHAETPTQPFKPNIAANTLIGFTAGMFLAVSAVFLIEYLDDTVRDTEDVEKLLDVPVIATIPLFTIK